MSQFFSYTYRMFLGENIGHPGAISPIKPLSLLCGIMVVLTPKAQCRHAGNAASDIKCQNQ